MTRYSGSDERNPDLKDWSRRYSKETNRSFFGDALEALRERGIAGDGRMTIGLVGQRDIPGVALRRAQAILRWDLRPSLWSHAFLISGGARGGVGNVRIREVSIHSRGGIFPEPEYNAVTDGRLGFYADPLVDANVALLSVAMSPADLRKVSTRAKRDVNLDRLRFNLWETLGVWVGWLWSGGAAPNPLREGFPVFSSAFVEYCFEAIEVDLAPATSERNSAPEHLWNAAVWWHDTFRSLEHAISGYYVVRDKYCTLLDPEELPSR
jgi:hypothetical protein